MLLYTLGDSFTYGEELPDPATQAWPVLLAEKLGYKLINRSLPGCGNNYIVKTAIKEIPKLKPDLVLVAWTNCGRMEFADEYSVYDIWPGCDRRWEQPYPHRDALIKYITDYNNEQHQYRSWLRSMILLQDFLKLRNIRYKFLSTFGNLALHQKYGKHSTEYLELVDTSNFVGWPDQEIINWTYGCPTGPRHHPLQSGHKVISNRVYGAL